MILFALLFLTSAFAQCPPIVGNCYLFLPEDEWNRPINNDPVDYQSSCIIAGTASASTLIKIDEGNLL